MSTVQKALDEAYGADTRIRVIHVQEFQAGDALVPNSETASEVSRKVS
jgi:hypothetical protein